VAPIADALAAVALTAAVLTTAAVVGRVRFARDRRSFRCRVRRTWPGGDQRPPRWRWFATHAMWAQDVLLMRAGFLRLGLTALVVCPARDAKVEPLLGADVRRLGRHPMSLRLTLADGGAMEIAVAEDHRTDLVGPFLAAALPGLPRAPREKGSDR
jgi:ABC-type Fe3+ transport system permease subunit